MILLIFAFVISFSLVAFMLPYILVLSLRKRLVDPIDPRKVHSLPASRLGGVAFYPAILFSVWLSIAMTNVIMSFIGPAVELDIRMIFESLSLLLLFLTGIYDDIIGVSYRKKFVMQIFAALLIICSGTYFKTFNGLFGIYEIPSYVGIIVTLFFYVFVTNAINLIDGIDGLASMLSMMALLVYTILFYGNGMVSDGLMTVATFGALMPFWYGNVFGIKRKAKSKIFMGDTGALVVGAILGFTAVRLWNVTLLGVSEEANRLHFILAYTMLLVPCFDVIRIIQHRFRHKKPLFMPDKNHIHHKFIALGFTHRQALACIVGMNAMFVVINILLSMVLSMTYIILVDIIIWTVMHVLISRKISKIQG